MAKEMKRCFKCGSQRNVISHHVSYNPEKIVDCCRKCHGIIHSRVRKEGRCPYSPKEVNRLSGISSTLRHTKSLKLTETILPNVLLYEQYQYQINTGNVYCNAYFYANHGKKLFEVEI